MKNIFYIIVLIVYPNLIFTQTIYVDSSATDGLNTGDNWTNAFTDLQDAMVEANEGQHIWVARGTYYPTNGSDQSVYFELKNGVQLLGGFEGDELEVSERNWIGNETILSGDIGIEDDSIDNSYTVLYASAIDTMTRIDGFIIEKGNASNDSINVPAISPKKNGGAIYLDGDGVDAVLNIVNCRIQENSSMLFGGAIYFNGLNGSTGAKIKNCSFRNNNANAGGAIYQRGGLNNHFGNEILESSFEHNSALLGSGGAVSLIGIDGDVDYRIIDCEFNNNSLQNLGTNGSAIFYDNSSTTSSNHLLVSKCQFIKNVGNVIYALKSFTGDDLVTIRNCEFYENMEGSVLFLFSFFNSQSNQKIENSIFENNYGTAITGIKNEISNCVFKNNKELAFSGVSDSSISDPTTFNNCTFFKNDSSANNIIFSSHKLVINNSIFYNDFITEDTLIQSSDSLTLSNCLLTLPSCDTAIVINDNSLLTCSNIILNANPLFRDTASGDFNIMACSLAKDAGNNNLLDIVENPFDIAGNERVIDGTIDLGAYESPVNLTVDSISHVLCFGASTGEVFPKFNGPGPYEYYWTSGSQNGNQVEGLEAGLYDLIVTDSTGCSDSISFEITVPQMLITSFQIDSVNCLGGNDGFAEVVVLGGVMPYELDWQNGEVEEENFNLSGGFNSVSITDVNGCILVDSVFIGEPDSLIVSWLVTDASEMVNQDGSIELLGVGGGVAPYSFLWSTGDTLNFISNLNPGDYSVLITDANGCEKTIDFIISFLDGVVDLKDPKVFTFPNPVKSSYFFQVNLPKEWSYLDPIIYNGKGQVMKRWMFYYINSNVLKIESPKETGLYFLKFIRGEETLFLKIVVVD